MTIINTDSQKNGTDSRSASNTVGYVLLVTSVVIVITTAITLGIPAIVDQQETQYMSNTERAFNLFADNINQIDRDTAPARETQIQLQDGTLNQSEKTVITVAVTNTNGDFEDFTMISTPITYEKDKQGVHYEFGSVIRTNSNSEIMRVEPQFNFQNGNAILSVISTSIDGQVPRISGTQSVILSAQESSTNAHTITSNPQKVTITVTSPRYKTWEEYFNEQGLVQESIDYNNKSVSYEFSGVDSFALRETQISVEIRS